MGNIGEQPFSGLSRHLPCGSSRGFEWATQGHSFLCCLGCVLRVFVLLEGEPLAQSEVLSAIDQVFRKKLLFFALFSFPSTLTSLPLLAVGKSSPQHDAATTMLHCWDGTGQVMSGVCFCPDMMPRNEAKQFKHGFIILENLVSHSLRFI